MEIDGCLGCRGEMQAIPFLSPPPKFADIDIVPVRIAFAGSELKQLAKAAGERWNSDERVSLILYGKKKGTKLKKHIVSDAMTGC